jgi:ribosomal protein L16 Arg81 hydroxylase/predicted enzyme related to lactoylglutathione lyase
VSGSITLAAQRPPPAGSTAVDTLLHPLGRDEFLAQYWHRRPVHLTGWEGRFAGLFDRDALADALNRQHESGVSVRVSGDHEGDDGGAGAHVLIDADDIAQQLRAGASLCVDPVDRVNPVVARMAAELRAGLGHPGPVSVKAYLSTPGFGFNTHFDAQVVTTAQIEGSKRWRVSPVPGVAFPTDNAFLDDTGTIRYNGRTPGSLAPWERPEVDRAAFVEVVLRPGDVLCLPAGTWHEAKATGGSSLALNFSFAPVDVATLLVELVQPGLEAHHDWRSGLAGDDPLVLLSRRAEQLATALHRLACGPALTPERVAGILTEPRRTAGGFLPAAAGHAAAVAASAVHAGHRLQCVLAVSDATKAAQWYGHILGGTVVSTIAEFGWVEVSTGVPGVTLGLTEMPTEVSNRGAVLDFEVDDLERVRRLLGEHGVRVEDSPTEIAGVARVLSAHDPDGNRLMFFEPHGQGSNP